MLMSFALALIWRGRGAWNDALTGFIAALSVLAWQANVFLLPALLAAVCLQSPRKSDRQNRIIKIAAAFGPPWVSVISVGQFIWAARA
jgi:hypothetical protein